MCSSSRQYLKSTIPTYQLSTNYVSTKYFYFHFSRPSQASPKSQSHPTPNSQHLPPNNLNNNSIFHLPYFLLPPTMSTPTTQPSQDPKSQEQPKLFLSSPSVNKTSKYNVTQFDDLRSIILCIGSSIAKYHTHDYSEIIAIDHKTKAYTPL